MMNENALKLVLNALQNSHPDDADHSRHLKAMEAVEIALQQTQEPYCWVWNIRNERGETEAVFYEPSYKKGYTPVYINKESKQ